MVPPLPFPPLPAPPLLGPAPAQRAASLIISILANHLARGQALEARLAPFEGRRLWLCVTDWQGCLKLSYARGAWRPAGNEAPDVVVRAAAADLLDIARRRADVDTLFFQRRLQMEGDTETGLLLRNLLESLDYDWPAHFRAVLPPPLERLALALYRRLGGATDRALPARPYQ